jgi:hypothetical protein
LRLLLPVSSLSLESGVVDGGGLGACHGTIPFQPRDLNHHPLSNTPKDIIYSCSLGQHLIVLCNIIATHMAKHGIKYI